MDCVVPAKIEFCTSEPLWLLPQAALGNLAVPEKSPLPDGGRCAKLVPRMNNQVGAMTNKAKYTKRTTTCAAARLPAPTGDDSD